MNKERLIRVIEDMNEVIKNLNECTMVLKTTQHNNTTLFIEFGLKQIFVDFFITVENFTSLVLKDIRKFKIGIDMKEALNILKDNNILDLDIYNMLNEARLLRNRISHRYKEPSTEELLEFVDDNSKNFNVILEIVTSFNN